MKTLDAIKQEYARENNFCEWSEILYSIDDPAEIDEHFDKVAKLYALEVAKEALKNANTKLSIFYFVDNNDKPISISDFTEIIENENNIPKEVK